MKKPSSAGDSRGRLPVVIGVMVAALLTLFLRFFYVQIIHNTYYATAGERQSTERVNLRPQRGEIFDANGTALAVNADLDTASLERLVRSLTGEGRKRALKRPLRRLYPHGALAGQILGFVGRDGAGLAGIEYGYDRTLYGEAGWSLERRDARSRRVFQLDLPVKQPVDGESIQLTLRAPVQEILEVCLAEGVTEAGAVSGSALVMDPATGDVLGMATYPSFDPNFFIATPKNGWRNDAVSMVYEPGSVFKLVAAAASLEEGVFRESDIFHTGDGKFKIFDEYIHDTHKNGDITFIQAVARSSNVAFAKMAVAVGSQRFYKYVKNFGFGQRLGVDLPGEESGILKPVERWSGRTLVTMAMGQEVSVTMLQMAAAYGALANGGVLMTPRIVKAVTRDGRVVREFEPRPVRRILSPLTARRLTECFAQVVEGDSGTGSNARIEGLRIAGKTGTAQKIDPATRKYLSDKYVASFIGFFPAESPRLLCMVLLNEPDKVHTGGMVSAPVFQKIVTRLIHSQELPYSPILIAADRCWRPATVAQVTVPDFRGQGLEALLPECRARGLALGVRNFGDQVSRQSLKPGRSVAPGTAMTVEMERPDSTRARRVPGVVGLTVREAVNRLLYEGFRVRVDGSGVVKTQTPPAGEVYRKSGTCVLAAGVKS
ncbi:MAG: penicillin-binding transpeptidase domain-containing protein [Fibrobacterota bacterium]